MTFLQVWVAAVRESRKLRNQPKLSYAEAFPRTAAAKMLRTQVRCRNQTTGLVHGNSRGSYTLSPLSR